MAQRSGWLHVDAAFGLWALADPSRADLVRGLDRADSWATDAHKWLNVTYDCGIAFVRRPADLRRTFAVAAGYLPPGGGFEAMHHTPQSSQRARQVEVWSVLRTLGRRGVADLVTRACDVATTIADRLRIDGLTILNEVVLNQVLVRLVDGPTTEALIAEIQSDGRIWCGPTQWDGATAMRISVSSWKTDLDDAAVRGRRDPRVCRSRPLGTELGALGREGELADPGEQHLDRRSVQTALGDDHVGVALARLDESLVARPHGREVLLDDVLRVCVRARRRRAAAAGSGAGRPACR